MILTKKRKATLLGVLTSLILGLAFMSASSAPARAEMERVVQLSALSVPMAKPEKPEINTALEPLHLIYRAYAGGLHLIDVDVDLSVGDQAYEISMDAETTGLVGALFEWRARKVARGVIEDGRAYPVEYISSGNLSDNEESTRMVYDGEGGFIKREVVPAPAEQGIEEIPEEMTKDTADMLTALVSAMAALDESGSCGQPVPIYDGRRRFNLVYRDRGADLLKKSRLNMYRGEAIRCSADVRLVKGRWKKQQRWLENAELRGGDENRGLVNVWFAQIMEDAPPVPVRLEIDSPLGVGIVHLRQVLKSNPDRPADSE